MTNDVFNIVLPKRDSVAKFRNILEISFNSVRLFSPKRFQVGYSVTEYDMRSVYWIFANK